MATAMESIVKEVKDITECSICTEMFCTPKMLPCFHTFCLKCIEQYCKDKEEGDTMPCPMCRKEFIVPTGGLSKLSGNFFIERLIAVQSAPEMNVNDIVHCDVCFAGKQCKVEASSFCMECEENMCDPCSNIHKSMKMTMSHHLSTIGDPAAMEAIRNKIRRTFCDKHPTEEIKFFCRDCATPLCTTCSIANHNKHECCDIEDIVEKFKTGFRQHSHDVSKLLANIKEQSDEVDEQLASFSLGIDTTEKSILERSEAIKRMVDTHAGALLERLSSHKTQCLKDIQTTKEELQRNMMMCENFVSYCQKAIEKANSVESIRIADELKTRAGELKGKRIPKLNTFPDILFLPSDFGVSTDLNNIVGNIRVKHSLESSPQGFAISKDELFSVFAYTPCVRVHRIEPFSFLRTIPVEGMKNPWHIVASDNVLYVSENCDELIHRIQLPEETVSNWTVEGSLLTLSIAKNGNVIVASCDPAKIFEYTSGGTLVRQIAVDQQDSNLISLQHALHSDGEKFLVCHTKKTHNRVCIIDSTGAVIKCYGESKGSGKGQLNLPLHLAICQNGSILVADCDNNRIIQLDASLEYMKEFVGFKRPWRLLLKEELGRLYVIEWNERSIKIFDM